MTPNMEETLIRFREQFDWHPIVENPAKLGTFKNFVVAGMGGSHLGPWLIKKFGGSDREIQIHRNYGMPNIPEGRLRSTLLIASSYSGSTEETLDAVQVAFEKGMHVACISTGGSLLEFARKHEIPFITIPDNGFEPRMAIGYSMLGVARLLGDAPLEAAIRQGGKHAEPGGTQSQGTALAQKLIGKTPLIWASSANLPLAYIWKIKFNETSKIPAFCNSMPELCHNELTGFDVAESTRDLFARYHVIMFDDPKDHPRIQKRMKIANEVLFERNIPVERVTLHGEGFEKIFNSALLGDWVSLGLPRHYGVPDAATPLIAEFKKKMAQE